MYNNNNRPVFLDLTRIKFPITALVSIGHRISGVMLFISLPIFIYLFGLSLQSAEGFAQVTRLLSRVEFKLLLIPYVWFLSHHLFTGIRHLFIDMDIGVDRRQARFSAWLVTGAGVVMLLSAMVFVW